MEITVALDGEKKRDLRFFSGDDMSLTIVVYEHDGDVSPIVVSNVRFAAADGSLPMDSEFVVPSNFFGRVPYRIVGEVEDITTTLAYGVMQTEGGWPSLFCWCSGSPWPYGIVGKADNITVLDAHANFDGTVSVEGALEELGDFKKSVGDISAAVEAATEAAESASEDAAYVAAQLPNLLTKPEAAAVNGAALLAFTAAEAQSIFDNALPLQDYSALRAYTERARSVRITGLYSLSSPDGTSGMFIRMDGDATSADNGGTVIVDASGRRWKRIYSGSLDVRVFGAKGDGTTDDAPAIQAAIDYLSTLPKGGELSGPGMTFRCDSTITLKDKVSLVGVSRWFTLSFNNAAQDGFVIGGSTAQTRREVRNLTVSGTVRDAFVCANWPTAQLGGIDLDVSNVSLLGAIATNGFTFANVYSSAFRNLSTSGATITNACYRFLATVNGVSFDNLYTGGGAGHLYCYYIDCEERPTGDVSLPSGHGILLNSPVAQGGKYGFYFARCRSLVVNNPYVENVANPVVIGLAGGAITARGVVFNGGTYGNVYVSNPYYANRGPIWYFVNARGVTVNSPEMFQPANARQLTITGGGGSSGQAWMLVNRDGTPAAYVIDHCGKNYATPPTVTAPAPLTGTVDTLTATVASGRITSITVSVAGASPVYAQAATYPVAILYGQRCNKIKFNAPYVGFSGDSACLHPFIGRDSTAVSTNGIDVDSDSAVDGQTVTTRKTEGLGHLQAHTFLDSTGAAVSYVTTAPLIASP
jgi:hypothetical protein